MATNIIIYDSRICGFCMAAKRLLDQKGWEYESRSVDGNSELRGKMQEMTGRTSVPQIFFGSTHVGGYDDLAALESDGELDDLYKTTDGQTL